MPEGPPSDVLELEAILAGGDTVPNLVSTYLHTDNGLPLLTSAGDLQAEGLDRPKVTPLPPPPMVSQSAVMPSSPPWSSMPEGSLSHGLELEAILASGNTAPNLVSEYLYADNNLTLLTSAVDLQAEGLDRPRVTPSQLTLGVEPRTSDRIISKATDLSELASADTRICANRESAFRSKERKVQYFKEMEQKVPTLQLETSPLSAQLTMLQGETIGLTAENNKMKIQLQSMDQRIKLQMALNAALQRELRHLQAALGHANFSNEKLGNQHCYHEDQAMQPATDCIPTASF